MVWQRFSMGEARCNRETGYNPVPPGETGCNPVPQGGETGYNPVPQLRFPLAVALVLACCGLARADDPDNCLFCHQYHGLSRYDREADQLHVFFINPEYTHAAHGPHARIACTDCHPRDEVAVVPHRPVSPVDCTTTCHLRNPGGLPRQYTHQNVEDLLQHSAHAYSVLDKLQFAGGPLLRPGQSNCLYCHDEPLFELPGGTFATLHAGGDRLLDRCDTCHAEQIPVDVAYYLRHVAARLSPARSSLEMAQVCAVCHADAVVQAQFETSNAVASYLRSFHGKAALLGDVTTANCVDCHVGRRQNAHMMLGADQPESSVHPDRVANSCRSTNCHPGADKAIAATSVHLDLAVQRGTIEYFLAAAFILFTVITFGPSMVIVVLELFALVIGREAPGLEKIEHLAQRLWNDPEGRRLLTRFTVSQRVQHWVLAILFILLALTGFPLKFADRDWARGLIDLFGGLANARLIHHWGGIALVIGLFAHLCYAFATLLGRMRRARAEGRPAGLLANVQALPMWVTPTDVRQMLHLFAYLLHLRHDRPMFGRFNVKEKFEYFGVFWGTVLLGLTGVLLWGEQIATRYVGGRVLNLALIAHTYEAFLAVIHVGILHIINVMLHPMVFPLSRATITGETPLPALAEEHTGQVLEVARKLGLATEGVDHD